MCYGGCKSGKESLSLRWYLKESHLGSLSYFMYILVYTHSLHYNSILYTMISNYPTISIVFDRRKKSSLTRKGTIEIRIFLLFCLLTFKQKKRQETPAFDMMNYCFTSLPFL